MWCEDFGMMEMWVKKQDNLRTVALGHMDLNRLVFDLLEYPLAVTEGCVRG